MMAEATQPAGVQAAPAFQPSSEGAGPAVTHASLITAGRTSAANAAPATVERGGSVARRAAGGAIWVMLAFAAGKALGFLTNIVLARLLTPGDFGLVSFAMILIGAFTLLQDLGVGAALVYNRDDVKKVAGTALTINLATALVLFAITVAGSVLMARLSGAAITETIVVVLAFGLIVTAAGSVQGAVLMKELAFRRKFLPDVVPLLVAGLVAVGMALLGFGVWSLVASYLAKSVTTTLLLWVLAPYRPRPGFSLPVARELLRYGRHISLSSVIGFGVMNVDYFLVGHMLGSRALGIYTLAFMVGTLPSTLVGQQIATATFPALSGLRHKPQELARLFGDAFAISGALATALASGIFVVIPVLVGPVLGPKWFAIITPLRILTIFGVLRALEYAFSPLYRAIGRPQIMWWLSLLRLIILAPALLLVVRSGINGVAVMQGAVGLPFIGLHLAVVAHLLGLRGAALWRLVAAQVVGGGVVVAIIAGGYALPSQTAAVDRPFGAIALAVVAVVAQLLAVSLLTPRFTALIRERASLLRRPRAGGASGPVTVGDGARTVERTGTRATSRCRGMVKERSMGTTYVWKREQHAAERLVWLGQHASADFWDRRWTELQLPRLIDDARHHRVLRDLFLRYSPPGGLVLEGGCGLGQWVVVLGEHGRRVVGVDFARATLTETKAVQPGLALAAADVTALPCAAANFDTYISLGLAEHFLDGPQPLLREACRVLKPGGYLLLSVPYFSPLRRLRARTGSYLPSTLVPPRAEFYQFAFQPSEFERFLGVAGFAVTEVVPFSASIGLAELPFLRRRRAAVRRGTGGTVASAGQGRGSRTRVSARQAGSWLVNSYPVRWFGGHMMLFVAQRQM